MISRLQTLVGSAPAPNREVLSATMAATGAKRTIANNRRRLSVNNGSRRPIQLFRRRARAARRKLNAERLGCLEIDREVEPRRLFDGKIARLHTPAPTLVPSSRETPSSGTHFCQRESISVQRPDVLFHAEKVLRIILRLQLLEAPVVGSVCGGDRVVRLIVTQVVHVPAGGEERLHLRIGLPRPGYARVGNGRLRPLGEHEEAVSVCAVREGRVADTDPGHGAVDVLEDQLAHWGGTSREAPDHRVDGIVAQPSKEARFPIVECPSRIGAIEHPVELAVGHWTERIEGRRPELLKWPYCFFAGAK